MSSEKKVSRDPSEKSFTLIETVIALGILVTIILEVSSVQGHAVNFSIFEQKVSQATWMAKGLMSQIEYKWRYYPLKEIEIDKKEQEFDEFLCPKDPDFGCDYKYNLLITKWDLPIVDILFRYS